VLGWQPQVAMRDGLQRTIGWIQNHLSFISLGMIPGNPFY
jgi:hypothetical protein